ncbi:hypothetical protein LTS15_008846 [Exophiala xenobiotica]|nr:hypothetical protein LTS15_008846 [Exophiala xenobiotica]
MWFPWKNSNNAEVSRKESPITDAPEANVELPTGRNIQDTSEPAKDEAPVTSQPLSADQVVHDSSLDTQPAAGSQPEMRSSSDSVGRQSEEKDVRQQTAKLQEIHLAPKNQSAGSQSSNKERTLADPFLTLTDEGTRQDTAAVEPTSNTLDKTWRQLSSLVDSYTGNLITTGDARRDVSAKREIVLRQLDIFSTSNGDSIPSDLHAALSHLQEAEQKLQEEDTLLVEQGDQIVEQGNRIFGPATQATLDFLEQQGITVQSLDTRSQGSIVSQNDIRRDETSDARLYLSKKGDVDLLRENLMELEEEQLLAAEGVNANQEEEPAILEALESRKRNLMQQLEEAEETLLQLRDKLPDRQVNIPEDQLRPLGDEDLLAATSEPANLDLERETAQETLTIPDLDENTSLIPSGRQHSLGQILNTVTDDNTIRSNMLVNAYLLYQLRLLPEEQETYTEALKRAAQSTDFPLETDLRHLMLGHWFEDVPKSKTKSKPSRRRVFSQEKGSLAVHTTQSLRTTQRQSEPQKVQHRPPFHAGDDSVRRKSLSPRKQHLNDRASLG